jgi:hypothetical protein
VGSKYQELLRASGYSEIGSIAESLPIKLHAKLIEFNNETEITKRPPTFSIVKEWVARAQRLAESAISFRLLVTPHCLQAI